MISRSEKETKKIAHDFALTLKGGEVVLLKGALGAGKSTFVRGAAEALGYGGPVRSPTFTLMNRYPIAHNGVQEILHLDLYRLNNPEELRTLALEETLGLPASIAFIEWPMEEPLLFDPVISVEIEILGEGERDVIIQK